MSVHLSVHWGGGVTYPGLVQGTNPRPARSGHWGTPRYLPPQPGQDGWEGIPQGTYSPWPGQDGGGGTQRYLPPPHRPGQDGGRGTSRYLPPARSGWGRGYPKVTTPSQVRMGEGVLQGTYPLARSGWEVPPGT